MSFLFCSHSLRSPLAPGSTVILNNEQVFSLADDATIRHFTSPLPKTGENQITITAQNRQGNTNSIHKSIIIE